MKGKERRKMWNIKSKEKIKRKIKKEKKKKKKGEIIL